MAKTYHQYCPVAHALDLVGERWALLVVRELMFGPKRYTDLAEGLAGIGTNILASRLRDLEQAGVVRKTKLPPPAGVSVYELTEYGRRLDDVLLALGRWGSRSLGVPQPDDCWSMYAIQTSFRPEAAEGVDEVYELRFDDEAVVTLAVCDCMLEATPGPSDAPDLVLEVEPGAMFDLVDRRLTTAEAVASGRARILTGKKAAFERLISMFELRASGEARDAA